MNEKGLRPYNWTGLSYNEWRNVVPQRKRQWDGEEFQELELKKPNQHFVKTKDGGVSWDNKAWGNSDYSDMIYTSDLQCMQKPYQASRYEKNLPEFSYESWESEELTPPSTPTGLHATAVSSSEIDLTWNAVDDALYYYVYRDGVYVGMASLSHYSDTGLSASTEYSYTVSAVNENGESEQCKSVTATTDSSGYSDDCSSLTGWTIDWGTVTQETFDSRSTFHLSGASLKFHRNIVSFADTFTLTIVTYCHVLGNYPGINNDPLWFVLTNNTDSLYIYFFANGLYTLQSGGENPVEIGTDLVALDTWQTWKFVCNPTAQTMDVYLDDVLKVTAQAWDSGYFAGTDGDMDIWQRGVAVSSETYIDSIVITKP